jgi:hypothetical protein
MASGHMNRVKRPDTWLHRPMLQNVKKVLANPEPSTHDPKETLQDHDRSRSPWTTTRHFESRRSIQWATAAEFLSLRSSSRDEFTIPSVP